MRCEECGHDLRAIPDGTPCTECGVVTPMERRWPAPMPGTGRVLLGFAWPALVVMGLAGLVAMLGMAVTPGGISPEVGVGLLIAVLVLVFVVAPLNTARRMHMLMQRLPRRVRAAPLLALVPRSVAVPLLAAIATVPVMMAIAFGGCMVVIMTFEGLWRAPAAASPSQPAATAATQQGVQDAPAPADPPAQGSP